VALFRPILAGATLPDRLVACAGATLGIAFTIAICALTPGQAPELPLIVAPLGASAVLVFAVPASPLAQPWPVIGGNIVSTAIGVAAFQLVPNIALAGGLAVGVAILVMSILRCLHPPGGAAALTAVIGGKAVHDAGYAFAFMPVGLNSLLLVGFALVFHRLSAHNYPHRAGPQGATAKRSFNDTDIDAALADMHESFDIGRDDLKALLEHAERHAAKRLNR